MQVNELPGRRHRALARLAAAAVLVTTYSVSAIDLSGFATPAMADEEKKKEDASRKRMHQKRSAEPASQKSQKGRQPRPNGRT